MAKRALRRFPRIGIPTARARKICRDCRGELARPYTQVDHYPEITLDEFRKPLDQAVRGTANRRRKLCPLSSVQPISQIRLSH